MQLSEKQKLIKSDIDYWNWFSAWWQEDFSWKGLKKNTYSDGNGTTNLQEMWAVEQNSLIEFAGRKWTRFHLPEHDLEGNPSPKLLLNDREGRAINRMEGIWNYKEHVTMFRDLMMIVKKAAEARAPVILAGIWLTFEYNYTHRVEQNRKAELEDLVLNLDARWTHNIGRINFRKVSFENEANFTNSYIYFFELGFGKKSSRVQFDHSIFFDNAIFMRNKFDNISFLGSVFHKRAIFKYSTFNDFANFTMCKFNGFVDFTECIFKDRTSFNDTVFNGLFVFRKGKLDPYVTFANTHFRQNKTNTLEDYETSFRSLQYALNDIKLYDEAFMFARRARVIRGQRKSMRQILSSQFKAFFHRRQKTQYLDNDSLSDGEIFLTKLYEFFCRSGQSIFLPLLWLMGCSILSIVIQYLVLIPKTNLCFQFNAQCGIYPEILMEAFSRAYVFSLPPLSTVSHSAMEFSGMAHISPVANLLSGLIMVSQGLFGSVFVFLSLQAVRRRLQIR